MQDFNYYDALPEELLEQVCDNMNDKELTKFVQAYSRAYHVCKKVYDQRKKHVQDIVIPKKKRQALDLAMSKELEREKAESSTQIGLMPTDVLVTLCNQADDQVLTNMAKNSARVRRICENVLEQRGIKTQRSYLRQLERSINP